MKLRAVLLLLLLASSSSIAQKVKTGHKKGTDFRQYHTFTFAPVELPIRRPLLAEMVKNGIVSEFEKRGLKQMESAGDLVLVAAGALDYQGNMAITTAYVPVPGYNNVIWDPGWWVGSTIAWSSSGTFFQQGTLVLQLMDAKTNEVVWMGTVKQSVNLDLDSKEKTLKLIDKAIVKLVSEYPPKDKR